MRHIFLFIALLHLAPALSQRSEELIGLKGKIKKIERQQYYGAKLKGNKWILEKDNHLKATVQFFDRNGLLQSDSTKYIMQNAWRAGYYQYRKGRLAETIWKDSTGQITDRRLIEWTDRRTAVATQLDGNGKCLYKLHWFYKRNKTMDHYIVTENCESNPETAYDSRGRFYYNKAKQRIKKEVWDANSAKPMTATYDVIEHDFMGNPTAVIEKFEGTNGDATSYAASLFYYTYFNTETVREEFRNIMVTESGEGYAQNSDQTVAEPQQAEEIVTDVPPEADSNTSSQNIRTPTKSFTACYDLNKYSLEQRLGFYPFSVAKKVALISFNDPATEPALYSDRNKLPTLAKAIKTVLLTDSQIDGLTNTLYNIGYSEEMLVKTTTSECGPLKNAIVFLDKNDKPFEYILLYFGCNQVEYSSRKVKDGDYCDEKFPMLEQLFTDNGIQVAK
ncbi:MAG TPA: hypothetical protein VGB50_10210 [Flavobacterium sp.]|jgi:hypothetical protein